MITAAAAATNVGFNFLLIPRYGAVGGAIASVCAYVFYGTASIVTVARLDGVPARSLLFANRDELRGLVRVLRARRS
jgi:O-antigen/teichoic acid export membrane protein